MIIINFFKILVLATNVLSGSVWNSAAKKFTSKEMAKEASILAKIRALNPSDLLESKGSQPKIYMQATLELKRLCDQPICHRMAAYILMNNCKGLDEIDEQNYQLNRGQLQQDQVDAFAATLTMCDMERAKFDIPKACLLFTSEKLARAAEINIDLKFSSREVNDCLQGLGKNAKHWSTWLSYRDSALLFCRAARLSIEKDESIALHRELLKIMKTFSKELYQDLKHLKENITVHKSLIDTLFKKINVEASDWKTTFNRMFGEVAQNIKDVNLELNNIFQKSSQAQSIFEEKMSSALRDSAQIVQDYQHDIELASKKQTEKLAFMEESLLSSEIHSTSIKNTLLGMQKWMFEMYENQKVAERQAKYFSTQLFNATVLLQDHTKELERVGSTASGIYEDLEKASLKTSSLTQSLILGLSRDLTIIILGTFIALVLGNHRLAPTRIGNIILVFSGLILGNLPALVRRQELPVFSRDGIWGYLIRICYFFSNSGKQPYANLTKNNSSLES